MGKKSEYKLDILSPQFIDKSSLVIIGFDKRGDVLYWNKQAKIVTGYTKKEASQQGLPLFQYIFLQGKDLVYESLAKGNPFYEILSGERSLKNKETSILTKTGQIRYIRWNSYLIKGKDPNSSKAVIITGADMTVSRALQRNLQEKNRFIKSASSRLKKYMSLDPHTGLTNYRHFIHKLNSTFYEAFEKKKSMSLLMMDVDYFCSINNTHGVSKGNRILRELATLVKKNVDEKFVVARFGGTEFAILMPDTDIKTAFSLSGKLFSLITDHKFSVNGFGLPINLSLHMALGGYPHCEDVFTPEQLLDNVIDKLKFAHKMGANSILICSPNETRQQATAEENQLNTDDPEYRYTVEFVNALANTVKIKDFYTQEHSAVMSNYAVFMAEYLGLSTHDVQNIRFGSILHDIGKLGIDKMILLKPGALTKREYEVIKQHPRIGAEIIRNVHPLKDVVPLVMYHHERFDGDGYLDGLKGEEIPLGARIISLADVFQALTSDRPYRKALPDMEALDIIKDYSNKYFDPEIVKAFLEIFRSMNTNDKPTEIQS